MIKRFLLSIITLISITTSFAFTTNSSNLYIRNTTTQSLTSHSNARIVNSLCNRTLASASAKDKFTKNNNTLIVNSEQLRISKSIFYFFQSLLIKQLSVQSKNLLDNTKEEKDIQKIMMSKKEVKHHLKKYLPGKVLGNLPNLKEETDDDGKPLYFSSVQSGKNNIHQLEVQMNEYELIWYHYKDYSFCNRHLQRTNISRRVAKAKAVSFAKTFFHDGDKLKFVHKNAYPSLYDPGHIEGWLANRKGKSYYVMVNLDYGYVELAYVDK